MYCPNSHCPDIVLRRIRSEYRDEILKCPACGAWLVPGDPPPLPPVSPPAPRVIPPEWADYPAKRRNFWIATLGWLIYAPVAAFVVMSVEGLDEKLRAFVFVV